MEKKRNLWVIPTDKQSRLVRDTINNNLFITTTKNFETSIMKFQNIYITSDEVKKNGDWVFSNLNEVVKFCSLYCQNFYKKIILTTDQDLIKDGVQEIDDEFLEWFVKNPSCKFVEVNNMYYGALGSFDDEL